MRDEDKLISKFDLDNQFKYIQTLWDSDFINKIKFPGGLETKIQRLKTGNKVIIFYKSNSAPYMEIQPMYKALMEVPTHLYLTFYFPIGQLRDTSSDFMNVLKKQTEKDLDNEYKVTVIYSAWGPFQGTRAYMGKMEEIKYLIEKNK